MSCVNLAIITIGDCSSKQNSVNNISLSSITKKLSQTEAVNEQSSNSVSLNVQSQDVLITGYTGTVSIKITQNMDIKIASKTKMDSVIKAEDMTELASSINNQIDDIAKQNTDIGGNSSIQSKITNVKKNITNVVTDSKLLKTMQKNMSEAVSIQDQKIVINFATVDPDTLKTFINTKKTPDSTSIPVIEISQSLVADIQQEAALSAITEAISSNKSVLSSVEQLKNELGSAQLGFGGVTAGAINEIGEVTGKAVDAASDIAQAGFDFAKWVPIVIGIVVVVAIIAFLLLGKSLFSNPEAMKVIADAARPGL